MTKLNPGGIFVTQSGPGSVYNVNECCGSIYQTLSSVFSCTFTYSADIPSFGSKWAFNLAFNRVDSDGDGDGDGEFDRVSLRSRSLTNSILKTRLSSSLRFYDGISHLGMFCLPKPMRDEIDIENRIITRDSPVFMY